ncbi:MAG: maleylpyruvate isomerase N-terminal domain-containing protein [Anaerolineaceae bacterium]
MHKSDYLNVLQQRWQEFLDSIVGLSPEQMKLPGVCGTWSVKDIIGHVTSWEQETLSTLPAILAGGSAPVYSQLYGSIDALNAYMVLGKNRQDLDEVLENLHKVHAKLLKFLEEVDPAQFSEETPFLVRLSMDTSEHYPEHSAAVLSWRAMQGL